MGSPSVTCHSTQMNVPHPPLDLPTPDIMQHLFFMSIIVVVIILGKYPKDVRNCTTTSTATITTVLVVMMVAGIP